MNIDDMLRSVGLRRTRAREVVLGLLATAGRPLSQAVGHEDATQVRVAALERGVGAADRLDVHAGGSNVTGGQFLR